MRVNDGGLGEGVDYCIEAYKIVYGFKELLGTAKCTMQREKCDVQLYIRYLSFFSLVGSRTLSHTVGNSLKQSRNTFSRCYSCLIVFIILYIPNTKHVQHNTSAFSNRKSCRENTSRNCFRKIYNEIPERRGTLQHEKHC